RTWYTETGNGSTRIWAHFERGDPNRQLSEINLRETVFFPDTAGLNYITVSGFTMRHAAPRWASPVSYQLGLIGTHMGKGWIIERCHISDSKCVGVCSGGIGNDGANTGAPKVVDIEQIGHHIVRDNTIERCGEAGVAGRTGFAASLITNNLIQDINFQMQFGGQETSAIKVHGATDLIISHNIIRRVFSSPTRGDIDSHFTGIWVDFANQGTRIAGNVIYDVDDYTIFIEANHGPLLIDNNILVDSPMMSDSERVILAHNLFCNSGIRYQKRDSRSSGYFLPHTLKQVKTLPAASRIGDRYYNNIFIAVGADRLHSKRGAASSTDPVNPQDYRSGSNVYYNGAPRQPWDQSGIENATFHASCKIQSLAGGAILQLAVDRSVLALQCPLVDTALIGPYSVIDQGMEQHDGSPIRLDRDYFGTSRNTTHPRVGPFERLKPGANTFTLRADDRFFAGKLPSLSPG
ncbi:MAG TPA: right-handed parallel beta-helix repeat-containing protein, partial [Terracidiphilus sp.]